MRNYLEIVKRCKVQSALSEKVIDDFLMYYVAEKEGYDKILKDEFGKFKHILQELPEKYVNLLKAEFIVSKIFTKNGLINKYLKHSAIKILPPEQYEFLEQQSEIAWKFSYAVILQNPSEDFYEMEDVFTGEKYLLHSPSIKITIKESSPELWFNLIGYNGACWQTFGLVIGFKSFNQDDIFFFATELNPTINDEDDLINEIEKNPIPFFMLITASNQPRIFNNGHEISYLSAVDSLDNFSNDAFKINFGIAWNENVFQLKLKKWSEFPHFAISYVDENKNIIVRSAMTDKGFNELTMALNKAGLKLSALSDIRVSLSMYGAVENILNKNIELNSYENLFSTEVHDDEKETDISNYTDFLRLAMPFINAGKTPDLEVLANQANIDLPAAKQLWEIVKKQRLGNGKKNR
jgi:hypothetical protein